MFMSPCCIGQLVGVPFVAVAGQRPKPHTIHAVACIKHTQLQGAESNQGPMPGLHKNSGVHRTLSAGQPTGQQQSMQGLLRGVPRAEGGAGRGQTREQGLLRQDSAGASRQMSGNVQSLLTPVQGRVDPRAETDHRQIESLRVAVQACKINMVPEAYAWISVMNCVFCSFCLAAFLVC